MTTPIHQRVQENFDSNSEGSDNQSKGLANIVMYKHGTLKFNSKFGVRSFRHTKTEKNSQSTFH